MCMDLRWLTATHGLQRGRHSRTISPHICPRGGATHSSRIQLIAANSEVLWRSTAHLQLYFKSHWRCFNESTRDHDCIKLFGCPPTTARFPSLNQPLNCRVTAWLWFWCNRIMAVRHWWVFQSTYRVDCSLCSAQPLGRSLTLICHAITKNLTGCGSQENPVQFIQLFWPIASCAISHRRRTQIAWTAPSSWLRL